MATTPETLRPSLETELNAGNNTDSHLDQGDYKASLESTTIQETVELENKRKAEELESEKEWEKQRQQEALDYEEYCRQQAEREREDLEYRNNAAMAVLQCIESGTPIEAEKMLEMYLHTPKSFYNEKVFMTVIKTFLGTESRDPNNVVINCFMLGFLGVGTECRIRSVKPLPIEEQTSIKKQVFEFIKNQDAEFFKVYGEAFLHVALIHKLDDVVDYMIKQKGVKLGKCPNLHTLLHNHLDSYGYDVHYHGRIGNDRQYQDRSTPADRKLFLEKIDLFLANGSQKELETSSRVLHSFWFDWVVRHLLERGQNPLLSGSSTVTFQLVLRSRFSFQAKLFNLYVE